MKEKNIKLRIKFRKFGPLRFIGHLDVMRFFQKAIRRAEIDVAYTGGFSPHQIMTFAAPLGVGLESNGEYKRTRHRGRLRKGASRHRRKRHGKRCGSRLYSGLPAGKGTADGYCQGASGLSGKGKDTVYERNEKGVQGA